MNERGWRSQSLELFSGWVHIQRTSSTVVVDKMTNYSVEYIYNFIYIYITFNRLPFNFHTSYRTHCFLQVPFLFIILFNFFYPSSFSMYVVPDQFSLLRGATHAPLIHLSSSIYYKKIDFKQKRWTKGG
jgi:hypothetical protein